MGLWKKGEWFLPAVTKFETSAVFDPALLNRCVLLLVFPILVSSSTSCKIDITAMLSPHHCISGVRQAKELEPRA